MIAKGFNAGYLLAQHRPALTEKLMPALKQSASSYNSGLVAGASQWQKEQAATVQPYQPRIGHAPDPSASNDHSQGIDL